MSMTRREALAAAAAGAVALSAREERATAANSPRASRPHAKVVALGTLAGPALVSAACKQPATALVVGSRVYLIDAGYDVVTQLRAAYLPFPELRHLLFTHYHSDHVAGYPALLALGYQHPQPIKRLDVWGPPPLAKMHGDLLDFYAVDDASRQSASAPPLTSIATPHEVEFPASGIADVFEDTAVKVTGTRVFHGEDVPEAYGYRFDIKSDGTSVVISGDTYEPAADLIALMQDADLLVHEAMSPAGVQQILGQIPADQRGGLKHHLLTTHTDVAKLPAIAKGANVGHVALTHFTPDLPAKAWRSAFNRAARKAGYKGGVTPLNDLQEIAVRNRP